MGLRIAQKVARVSIAHLGVREDVWGREPAVQHIQAESPHKVVPLESFCGRTDRGGCNEEPVLDTEHELLQEHLRQSIA